MGRLTMVEKGWCCDNVADWPLFYMNDFSVLGLIVGNLDRAAGVLEAGGYRLVRGRCGTKVDFDNHGRLQKIYEILKANSITFTMTDLVSGVYQG